MKKPLDYSRHITEGTLANWPLTTMNPSDLLLHVLKFVQRIKNNELDLESLQDWKIYCHERGYTYTAKRHYESIQAFCMEILDAGHGVLSVSTDGKFKVESREQWQYHSTS